MNKLCVEDRTSASKHNKYNDTKIKAQYLFNVIKQLFHDLVPFFAVSFENVEPNLIY